MDMRITAKLALMILVLSIVALVMVIGFSSWIAQDKCLDSGGAWHDGRCSH